jgi:hypothetical protein
MPASTQMQSRAAGRVAPSSSPHAEAAEGACRDPLSYQCVAEPAGPRLTTHVRPKRPPPPHGRCRRDAVTRPGARSWLLLPQPSDALDTTRLLAQRADRRSASKHADYRSRSRAGVHLEAGNAVEFEQFQPRSSQRRHCWFHEYPTLSRVPDRPARLCIGTIPALFPSRSPGGRYGPAPVPIEKSDERLSRVLGLPLFGRSSTS